MVLHALLGALTVRNLDDDVKRRLRTCAADPSSTSMIVLDTNVVGTGVTLIGPRAERQAPRGDSLTRRALRASTSAAAVAGSSLRATTSSSSSWTVGSSRIDASS